MITRGHAALHYNRPGSVSEVGHPITYKHSGEEKRVSHASIKSGVS